MLLQSLLFCVSRWEWQVLEIVVATGSNRLQSLYNLGHHGGLLGAIWLEVFMVLGPADHGWCCCD